MQTSWKKKSPNLQELQVGSKAPLVDALTIVCKHFNEDKPTGRSIMKKLLPKEAHSRQDFMIYYIAFKMQYIGKTFEQIFTLMDTDRNRKIDTGELVSGIQKRLGILFAIEECTEVLEYLDVDSSGDVNYFEFRSKISELVHKKYRKN